MKNNFYINLITKTASIILIMLAVFPLISLIVNLNLTSAFIEKSLILFSSKSFLLQFQSLILNIGYGFLFLTIFAIFPAIIISFFKFKFKKIALFAFLMPILIPPYLLANIYTVKYSYDFLSSNLFNSLYLTISISPYCFIILLLAFYYNGNNFLILSKIFNLSFFNTIKKIFLPLYFSSFIFIFIFLTAFISADYSTFDRTSTSSITKALFILYSASHSSEIIYILTLTLLIIPVIAVSFSFFYFNKKLKHTRTYKDLTFKPFQNLNLITKIIFWIITFFIAAFSFFLPVILCIKWAYSYFHMLKFSTLGIEFLYSISGAIIGCCIIIILSLLFFLIFIFNKNFFSKIIPWVFLPNLFIPSIVLGISFLLATKTESFLYQIPFIYESIFLILIAQSLKFAPIALFICYSSLLKQPQNLLTISQAFGFNYFKSHLIVYLKPFLSALLLASSIIFIELIKELDLALMLQPFGFKSFSLRIYSFSRFQNIDRASFWILISIATMMPAFIFLSLNVFKILRKNNDNF